MTLQEEVDGREWFHTIDLGGGVRTPGVKDTPAELPHMRLPVDLSGMSVLDVGAFDGFYSFEAERRGASRVVAVDSWAWNWPGSDARRNFDLAHDVLGSKVEAIDLPVEALRPEAIGGEFDLVLFLGVLYHAPDPLGYLRRVRSVTSGMAIVETVVDLLDIRVPAAAYYPAETLNNDASNHYGPNEAALRGLITDAGFVAVETFPPWQERRDWGIEDDSHRPGLMARLRRRVRSGRMVAFAQAGGTGPSD